METRGNTSQIALEVSRRVPSILEYRIQITSQYIPAIWKPDVRIRSQHLLTDLALGQTSICATGQGSIVEFSNTKNKCLNSWDAGFEKFSICFVPSSGIKLHIPESQKRIHWEPPPGIDWNRRLATSKETRRKLVQTKLLPLSIQDLNPNNFYCGQQSHVWTPAFCCCVLVDSTSSWKSLVGTTCKEINGCSKKDALPRHGGIFCEEPQLQSGTSHIQNVSTAPGFPCTHRQHNAARCPKLDLPYSWVCGQDCLLVLAYCRIDSEKHEPKRQITLPLCCIEEAFDRARIRGGITILGDNYSPSSPSPNQNHASDPHQFRDVSNMKYSENEHFQFQNRRYAT